MNEHGQAKSPKLLTYPEAADTLGISVSHLKREVAVRAIGVVRIGPRGIRFSVADLDAWVARHRVPPARNQRGA